MHADNDDGEETTSTRMSVTAVMATASTGGNHDHDEMIITSHS